MQSTSLNLEKGVGPLRSLASFKPNCRSLRSLPRRCGASLDVVSGADPDGLFFLLHKKHVRNSSGRYGLAGGRHRLLVIRLNGFSKNQGGDVGSQSFSQPGSDNTEDHDADAQCRLQEYPPDAVHIESDTEID